MDNVNIHRFQLSRCLISGFWVNIPSTSTPAPDESQYFACYYCELSLGCWLFMNQRPRCAKSIAKLTESRCEEGLLERHVNFAAGCKQAVYALSFPRTVQCEIEIRASYPLEAIRGYIVPDQSCLANENTSVNYRIFLRCRILRIAGNFASLD
jgi:hypothetical protein